MSAEIESKKTVLVTGGSRGLGISITQRLYSSGYRVVAASRNCSAELKAVIERSAGDVIFEELDLSNASSLHDWCGQYIEKHGAPYALINNAAIAHDGVLGTMHETQIIETIQVNVTATIILTKYISRSMLRHRNGRIVNVSSIIGSTGFNGLSVYGASKAAMNGFTKSLSRELGRIGITVNSLAPGYMATDMTSGIDDRQLQQISRRSALRRLATTDEAASAVDYLLSEAASAITGTILTVDAGNTA